MKKDIKSYIIFSELLCLISYEFNGCCINRNIGPAFLYNMITLKNTQPYLNSTNFIVVIPLNISLLYNNTPFSILFSEML
jgi:hypothetical protein